ncbi:MAG: gamma-glutamyltranspeptidase, partial [Faecalibacterium prausnitzii]
MKLFAALLALTLSLAGCGPVDGDPIRSGAAASDSAPRPDAVTVAQLRQQAEQNGSLAAVLYLGSVPERTADVDAALEVLKPQWTFLSDIPADRWVAAPGGGRELYCIFAVRRQDTLFVYEKQDPQYPHQTGRELYCKQDGQPILLLCNGTPDTPDTTAVVYCTTGRALDWSPRL